MLHPSPLPIYHLLYIGSYYDDTGMWVVFGIGSFGRQESMNMGKCYWMNLDTNTAVIGQVKTATTPRHSCGVRTPLN